MGVPLPDRRPRRLRHQRDLLAPLPDLGLPPVRRLGPDHAEALQPLALHDGLQADLPPVVVVVVLFAPREQLLPVEVVARARALPCFLPERPPPRALHQPHQREVVVVPVRLGAVFAPVVRALGVYDDRAPRVRRPVREYGVDRLLVALGREVRDAVLDELEPGLDAQRAAPRRQRQRGRGVGGVEEGVEIRPEQLPVDGQAEQRLGRVRADGVGVVDAAAPELGRAVPPRAHARVDHVGHGIHNREAQLVQLAHARERQPHAPLRQRQVRQVREPARQARGQLGLVGRRLARPVAQRARRRAHEHVRRRPEEHPAAGPRQLQDRVRVRRLHARAQRAARRGHVEEVLDVVQVRGQHH